MIVSVALLGFGLIAAIRINRGELLILKRKDWSIISAGGIIVAVSFTFDAGHILLGGMPRAFLWPVFAIGMAVAGHGARTIVLTRSRPI